MSRKPKKVVDKVWRSLSAKDRAAIERGTRAYYEAWATNRFPPYDEAVKSEEGSEILADFYRDLIGRPIALRREAKVRANLDRIAAIIEAVENRCMAADGPVTPTLREMTQAEISEIYKLASHA